MKKILFKKNQDFLNHFESFLKKHIQLLSPRLFKGHQLLQDCIAYTLLGGGKRFRPLVVFHTAQVCSTPLEFILPWAGAIEMIHTASLIHDDLPSMDNSPQRRGKPSNHLVFGEDMALLAGNCLWIEAFRLIEPYKTTQWISLLCQAVGFNGLMGGQALDLRPENTKKYYQNLHEMKTAQLISISMKGILSLQKKKNLKLWELSHLIGHAFQLADDLEDFKHDRHSVIQTLGKKEAKKKLSDLTCQSLNLIGEHKNSMGLRDLVLLNSQRVMQRSLRQ